MKITWNEKATYLFAVTVLIDVLDNIKLWIGHGRPGASIGRDWMMDGREADITVTGIPGPRSKIAARMLEDLGIDASFCFAEDEMCVSYPEDEELFVKRLSQGMSVQVWVNEDALFQFGELEIVPNGKVVATEVKHYKP